MPTQPRASRDWLLALAGAGGYFFAREQVQRRREADMRGQVAFITGGSRGLGMLTAREFAKQGCRIAICARDTEELARAREHLDAYTTEIMALPCDVRDQQQVEHVVNQITQHFGQIDILVNNAGVIQVGPMHDMPLEVYQEAMDVMYWGMVYTTLAVLPQMRRRKAGRIVNVTSVGGKVSVPHLLPYSAAKFAGTGFSEGLHAEVAGDGITVTTICPGVLRDGAQVNSYFVGRTEKEYTWFSLAASLPIMSLDADEAARQIVQACRRGESERLLGAPAKTLSLLHGLFPQAVIQTLGLFNRYFLPKPKGSGQPNGSRRGMDIQQEMQNTPLTAATTLGLKAAENNNEYPGPTEILNN